MVPVGHSLDEPSVGGAFFVELSGIDISHSPSAVTALHILGFEVEPVVLRQVNKQLIKTSAVIENQVHNNFDSMFVRFLNIVFIIFVGTEPRVDVIVVGDGISMIGLSLHVVLLQWCWPDGGDAELL